MVDPDTEQEFREFPSPLGVWGYLTGDSVFLYVLPYDDVSVPSRGLGLSNPVDIITEIC